MSGLSGKVARPEGVINPQYRRGTSKQAPVEYGCNSRGQEPVKTALPKITPCPYIIRAGLPAMAINVL